MPLTPRTFPKPATTRRLLHQVTHQIPTHFPFPIMAITPSPAKRRVRHSLPAVLMRAGTSKGLFIHRAHLPPSESDWSAPLLAAMGSRHADARQIDGVGGGSSVTSKVAVISPSARPGADVEYTFVQVAVGSEKIDMSGNCGNICSGVGPFAVQEGLVAAPLGVREVDVRIFNTNTSRLIVETVRLDGEGNVEEDGDCVIPGVEGPGSEIRVAFVEPVGSMTGKLFPSGRRSEKIAVEEVPALGSFEVEATLVDSANPFVLVDAQTLPATLTGEAADSALSLEVAEAIRRRGAVLMSLAGSLEEAGLVRGTPKLAYLSQPLVRDLTKGAADIRVQAYSMGKPHPSLQLTGGVTIASTMIMEGTVAHRIAGRAVTLQMDGIPTPRRTPSPPAAEAKSLSPESSDLLTDEELGKSQLFRIEHGSGVMEVEAQTRDGEGGVVVDRCVVSRTARRLFEGNVLYYT